MKLLKCGDTWDEYTYIHVSYTAYFLKLVCSLSFVASIRSRLDVLQQQLADLRNRRQQQELEIANIENYALRQRFQAILDNLLTEQLEKEQEVNCNVLQCPSFIQTCSLSTLHTSLDLFFSFFSLLSFVHHAVHVRPSVSLLLACEKLNWVLGNLVWNLCHCRLLS